MNAAHYTGRSTRRSSSFARIARGARSPGIITIVSDVVLAAVWAAMIPGLMWLGVAGGF